jgi:signal transduction histidine kinase
VISLIPARFQPMPGRSRDMASPPGLFLLAGLQLPREGGPEPVPDVDAALSASAARRRLAQEADGIGHWEWDLDADAITLSREASAMLGLPIGAPLARLRQEWPRICHPDDRGEVAELKRQVADGCSPVLAELRIRGGGTNGYRRVVIRGHADPGPRRRLLGELIDVTERRRAQAEAEAAAALFRQVTEAAPGMLYVIDLETGVVEHLNRGYLAFLPDGPSRGVEATQALWALVHPADVPALRRHRRACLALADGAVGEITLRLRLADGSLRWMHSQRRAIARGADGRVTRLVCSAQDVTSLRHSAETLQQLTRRLLTMQDDERRRIARDLHDSTAQNLLGASLAIRAALAKSGASAELDEALELIEGSQQEIRTLSYLLHPPLLDEMGLPAALAWYADGFSKRSGLPVALDLPDRCAEAGRLPLSREAETAMFRVAQEALANAWRHARASGITIGLRLDGEGGRRMVRLRIADDGQGMEARSGCAGLGLASMRERMKAVGGTLSLESRPGTGVVVEASSLAGSVEASSLAGSVEAEGPLVVT